MAQAQTLGEEHGLATVLAAHKARDAGSIELFAGDGAAAERELAPACEFLERVGEFGYLSSVAPILADALYEQGRYDEALLATERWTPDRLTVPEDADAQAGWRRVRAKALARGGDLEEGERLAREAVEISERTEHVTLRAFVVADLGEVLALSGRADESAVATAEALRLYTLKGNIAGAALLADRSASAQG
jgi:tetratricopeptide (TPR) repeat protein